VSYFAARWRRSILLRTTVTVLLLSGFVIASAGTALFIQISHGIYRDKLSGSISEAQSLIDYDQGRLDATRYRTDIKLNEVIKEILSISSVGRTPESKEVILVATASVPGYVRIYQGTSNHLKLSGIPSAFRKQVRDSNGVQSLRLNVFYETGPNRDAIVVGKTIVIPQDHLYEIYYIFPLHEQNQLIALIKNLMLFTAFGLILLIGLITGLVIRRIAMPLREAAEIAEQLAAGELDRRLAIRSEDEMGRLAIAFNEMALSMQQQISRLENLSRLQQRFVSDVSHELRTPLTTMRMASRVIYDARVQLDSAAGRSSELLLLQIDRFESLLTDLLEVSRFDARAAILETREVDLKALVSRAIDELKSSGEVQVTLSAPTGLVLANVDDRRIERVIRNLLTNAADHSDHRGVAVTIAQTDREVAIGVRDYGNGFTEREAERLFDRFWRADPSRARKRGGTGLGLSISLEDATLHQGTLKAWGAPKRGAHFVLTLPKSPGIPIQSEPLEVLPKDESASILPQLDSSEE